ncbi:putative Dolichol kinase [Hypsibius exemplaris]|uniref:dolichol kinase n=1 Tax=Hypsibius exemplaris TaxID=2072580 RepID=A0A1W0XCJ6_HYPEX|nr:putative Dolichol kinase [Hypsibius exemplaris]
MESDSCFSLLHASLANSSRNPLSASVLLIEAAAHCLSNPVRLRLILFWTLLVLLSIAWCYASPLLNLHTSSKRKFFHFAISAVYVSGIVFDFEFLCVAAVCALIAFVISEICRLCGPTLLRRILNDAFTSLLDSKDQGTFIFSHFYLLLGMSLPIWLDYLTASSRTGHTVVSYAGVVTVGVGDSFAAIIGRACGRHRWPRRNRTLEGSAAMLFSQLVTFEVLRWCDPVAFYLSGDGLAIELWSLRAGWFVHCLLTTLAEVYVEGSDNVMVPLFSVLILWVSKWIRELGGFTSTLIFAQKSDL